MPAAPDEFLNRALLRQLAGEQLFASGEQCFVLGRVQQIRTAKERVSARVKGSLTYEVKLWRRRGELLFRCDCEAGQAETFCKHCVAVGLAWLSRAEHTAPAESSGTQRAMRKEAEARREQERRHLALHLESVGKARLANLLLEATDYDEILRRRLLLETIGVVRDPGMRPHVGRALPKPDFAAYRRLLGEAISPTGFVDYHAMPDYAQGIEEAIAPMKELLRAGWHAEVVALTEFVLLELDAASDRVDTGDGLLNKAYDRLQRYHMEACRSGVPRVRDLAARLLHYELEGGLGIFNNAAKTYADILGAEGLSAWRTLLVREWQKTVGKAAPASGPDAGGPLLLDHRRFQVQMLTERLAREAGDMGTLLALKEADLRGVHDHIALAEWLAATGRHEDAIYRAESAARAFPAEPERAVWRGFLIAAYQRANRHESALRLVWDQFVESGELEHFRELKTLILAHHAAAWPAWRHKAFEKMRRWVQDVQHRLQAIPGVERPDGSRVVELLLEEEMFDDAWHEAVQEGCREDLWLLMASHRESDHPLDVLPIYQRQIDARLAAGPRADYQEVIELLARVRTLFGRLKRNGEYEQYRLSLRHTHRQKRGFLRLLDTASV